MSIFNLFSRKQEPKDVVFWDWFQKNEARLYDFENEQNRIFMELRRELDKYYLGLAFEFGPKIEGIRDFVISADGIKAVFPFVTALADAAPPLPRWKVIKFRPRREPFAEIEYEGVAIKIDEIRFSLEPEGEKTGITLYFDNFDESKLRVYQGITFLYLDNCLGEFDVATKVGSLDVKPASDPSPVTKLPLTDLAGTFDRLITVRSN